MPLAVIAVFLLAYLDLRREERRALDDFTAEQAALARVAAASLHAHVAVTSTGLEAALRHLHDDVAGDALEAAGIRVVVLDDARRWIVLEPAPTSIGSWRGVESGAVAGLADLLRQMATGVRGTASLDRPAAASLGLERRMAVAGFAPVERADGRRWSVAVIVSAMRVRDRAAIGAYRLAAAVGLAGLLVALFGVLARRQQRSALALAEQLRQAQATATLARAEKLATVGTLSAGVAHEIGTPLGVISGRAEQVLKLLPAGEGAEPQRKALTSILTQVDKVSSTIRQLLDFARVRPIEARAIAPAQLLATASALLEHRFHQAKVSLAVAAPLTVPPLAGDIGQLEQVLVNLLMNAVDACPPGGKVEARAAPDGARILIEISDDGCGIAPEHLGNVLDPFFTTKKRGQGTGLGLTIAADIVKNHGGSLAIDSLVGGGTTVRVWLPATTPQRASEA